MSKLRTAVLTFIDKGASWAKVDNLTQMEMCSIRPFFPHSLEQLHRFRKVKNISHANTTSNETYILKYFNFRFQTIQVARLYAAGNSSSDVRRQLRM